MNNISHEYIYNSGSIWGREILPSSSRCELCNHLLSYKSTMPHSTYPQVKTDLTSYSIWSSDPREHHWKNIPTYINVQHTNLTAKIRSLFASTRSHYLYKLVIRSTKSWNKYHSNKQTNQVKELFIYVYFKSTLTRLVKETN